ncbi:MAG: radical SAM protein [Actinomycetota bacterium]
MTTAKTKQLIHSEIASSCYFRTSVGPPYRKALVQITERCNLHCVHCFVSAGNYGDIMTLDNIQNLLIPRLEQCRVTRVTLTGGEPFAHADIIEIVRLLAGHSFSVGICRLTPPTGRRMR